MYEYYKEINESVNIIEKEVARLRKLILLDNKEPDDIIKAEELKLKVIEGRSKKNDNTK